jgi:hypothetical protein
MTMPGSTPDRPPVGHPYLAEIDAERERWYELVGVVGLLTPQECLEPGYYRDPDWTVRDVVAHLGTWLAETQVQFQRMSAGTYEGHDIDIDGINAALLAGMQGQPWDVAWVQARAARTRMLKEWYALREPSQEAAWWIRKGAAEHVGEHLGRVREWSDELIGRRSDQART